MDFLISVSVFLAACLIAVPLFQGMRLGAILGYLVAGVVIGPSVLNIIDDPYTILHFAELGVVLLLFVIGLELSPSMLWKMRTSILVSGGSQLMMTGLSITAITHYAFGFSWPQSITVGLALALSSTAFAIQLMNEQRILKTPPGQQGFSILLMQDVAVIPILLIVASFSPLQNNDAPAWYISVTVVISVLIIGKFFINPFLRLIAKFGNAEVMTAAALFIVLVTALAMYKSGLSMGMGAFIAGILLADSSFKHQLESEIEPFKGLLLGLFFIAIGMTLDLSLLMKQPVQIFTLTIALIAVKSVIVFAILKMTKQSNTDSSRVGLMLCQGGEFAFVVMTLAVSQSVLPEHTANIVNLVVGLSMALTSPIVIIQSTLFNTNNCPPVYDNHQVTSEPTVIIAGFGRFGQITGRVLSANNIAFTAMDKDAEHIEFVKKFGHKVYFGDATHSELLKHAGINSAQIVLIAINNMKEISTLARLIKREFPHIRIIARAHNRMHAVELSKMGVDSVIRELFTGGIDACRSVLSEIGYTPNQADRMLDIFSQHDEDMLQHAINSDLSTQGLVDRGNLGRQELIELFEKDRE
ncbi:monovalent cation:proton antiporter-2 (CPA2) family protein [Alteromonas facilis]|uniref:monovalent cation:proton antiporter-2 (CPA2) family protein n=1 Tax=Alteromonas facilis TaxID=2048004 RepID=UPI000C283220|nr:monovalent cation:proton antiporter-2 (CPA2) family protein [Alteromonas facilis]